MGAIILGILISGGSVLIIYKENKNYSIKKKKLYIT